MALSTSIVIAVANALALHENVLFMLLFSSGMNDVHIYLSLHCDKNSQFWVSRVQKTKKARLDWHVSATWFLCK